MFVSLRNFSKSCHISIFIKSDAKEIYIKIELLSLNHVIVKGQNKGELKIHP